MRKFVEALKGRRAISIAIIAAFVAVLVLIAAIFKVGKSRDREISTNMLDFESYIAAYTSGAISSSSTIQVELAQTPPEHGANGEKAPSKLMKITPSVKGNLQWANPQTLIFTPSEPLTSGQEYRVTVAVGQLFEDVPPQAEYFTFAVRVLRQSISIGSADYYINETPSAQGAIRGEIYTSDAATPEQLSEAITVVVDKTRNVKVEVTPTDTPNTFRFLSTPIAEGSKTASVHYTGKSRTIEGFEDWVVTLPNDNGFNMLSYYAEDRAAQSVRIIFSQPLDKEQNLDGLIYGEGIVDPRYKVDGNILTIFPSNNLKGDYTLTLEQSIRSAKGNSLSQSTECKVTFSGRDPEVAFLKNGYIVPALGRVQIPIRTVGLRAIDVSVYKIFQSNLLYSFQDNYSFEDYGGGLQRVGKLLFRKTIALDEEAKGQNSIYTLDLTSLIDAEPGAMYRIGLSMRKELSSASTVPLVDVALTKDTYEKWGYDSDYQMDIYDYDWNERNDPTSNAYYAYRGFTWRNVLVSNIGIIAKRNQANDISCYTTNLIEGTPLAGVSVKLYSYQLQEIASATSNNEGLATMHFPEDEDPFLIVAEQGGSRSYLNVHNASDKLSYSTFEVGGVLSQKGLQGFFYGDRGVWRPGDSIFMTLMVEDRLSRLPAQHPVEFTLLTPRGQVVNRQVAQGNSMKMYTFRTSTSPDAETGNYRVEARIGGTTFRERVRIETIKPNRLKANLTLDEGMLRAGANVTASLSSAWLHGAKASNLAASVDAVFTTQEIPFNGYEQYVFSSVNNSTEREETNLFSGHLDEEGRVRFNVQVPRLKMSTRTKVLLRTKVFEPGGGYTINMSSSSYSPYPCYVGVQTPKHDSYYLETDKDQQFKVVTLNSDGTPRANVPVEVRVYKVNWSWWWEHDNETLSAYLSSDGKEQVGKTLSITTDGNGTGKFPVRINYPAWGRYIVYAEDENGGHVSAQYVYFDWPSEYERSVNRFGDDSKVLTFESDKPLYEVGERATLRIPTAQNGRLLVSIENAERVVQSMWVQAKSKGTEVSFEVTEDMLPNAYANVMLIQPYGQGFNDLPLRMYGAIPIMVESRDSRIAPALKLPEEVRPDTEFTAEVHEEKGRPMCFTLAVIDEGLLDVTNFATPDPWQYFHQKRALGIDTYDFYDEVMGGYAGRITGVLNVGGGEVGNEKAAKPHASRFKPVAQFYGPYELKSRETKKIKIKLSNYVGSVRAMVVAKNDKAQGSTEVTLPVRNPLMVQPTLPRVLGVNEQIDLPVAVFAMADKIRDVTVKIETNDVLTVTNPKQHVTFKEQGDKIIRFPVKTGVKTGIGKVKITATGNGEEAIAELEIDVRNPNPRIVRMSSETVAKGQSVTINYPTLTHEDDAMGAVEVSRFPSMNYARLLEYADDYPFNGLEQQTTRALVHLLYGELVNIDKNTQQELSSKVRKFIGDLQRYQTARGGFSQWPGYSREDYWTTNYVGHFFAEASLRGYAIPSSVLSQWQTYQQQTANAWSSSRSLDDPPLQQAYRLYTLARMGHAQLGAMNRLRNVDGIPQPAARRLAAAYLAAGNEKIGKAMLSAQEKPGAADSHTSLYACYGSSLRNRAMLLEELSEFKELGRALTTLESIVSEITSDSWLTSQEVGFTMLGAMKFAKASNANQAANIKGTLRIDGAKHDVKGNAPSYTIHFTPRQNENGKVIFENEGDATVFISNAISGVPVGVQTQATSNNISLDVRYVSLDGTNVAPDKLYQGDDFKIVVRVKNLGYKGDLDQLALTVPLPSGWELRLSSIEGDDENSRSSSFYYQDQRDDRVLTYFRLDANQTKQFVFDVSASYAGTYVLPSVSCRALYDSEVSASSAGRTVTVTNR